MKENIKKYAAIIVVAVVAIVLIVCLCGSINNKKPVKCVNSFVKALNEGDFQKAQKYTIDNTFNMFAIDAQSEQNEQVKYFFKNLKVSVEDLKNSKGQAVVKLKVTNKNLRTVMGNYHAKALELANSVIYTPDQNMAQELLDYFIYQIESDEVETVTTELDLFLNEIDGEWKIIVTQPVRDAMLPGLSQVDGMFQPSK